jgi:hypothetical protein
MKKVILVLAALALVVSGVAAVSAYEAHVVNVRMKVETALTVPTLKIDFGTVFPEEWLTKEFKVRHSTSFCEFEQGTRRASGTNVDAIDYQVWVQRKKVETPPPVPYPDPVETINGVDYYYWLGDALYIGVFEEEPVDPTLKYPEGASGHGAAGVLKRVTTDTGPQPDDPILVATGTLTITKAAYGAPDDVYDVVVIGLDVPVFDGYWNELTDVPLKPSGFDKPTVVLKGPRNVQHIILGADIVIQVTNVYKWVP